MKKLYIAGNWKMNLIASEAKELINQLKALIAKQDTSGIEIIAFPPFINVETVAREAEGSSVKIGTQNCHHENKGAYTGEVSIPMLKYFNCEYCIVGHSERRQYFNEANQFINQKIKALISEKITPILCIGETLQERQSKMTFEVLKLQLDESLAGISDEDMANIIIAYEPIWAIGTGVTATTDQITETHNNLRTYLIDKYPTNGKNVPIQYGGSVNDKNAEEIFAVDNVNGALVGGASLEAKKFFTIIEAGIKQSEQC